MRRVIERATKPIDSCSLVDGVQTVAGACLPPRSTGTQRTLWAHRHANPKKRRAGGVRDPSAGRAETLLVGALVPVRMDPWLESLSPFFAGVARAGWSSSSSIGPRWFIASMFYRNVPWACGVHLFVRI